MSVLGEPWPHSSPKTITTDDGSQVTITVYTYGLVYDDGGGATNLAHVEETDDPDVLLVAGRKFRATP